MFDRLAKNQTIAKILIVTMLYISGLSSANAVMIPTSELANQQQLQIDRNKLLQSLDREEVQSALIERGVDPAMAKQRVMSMTAEEIRLMNEQMDKLPAGAGFLEVALIVFLVLLFTDIMGYTDIFPFVKKTVK
jgi:hypothetical protein